MMMTGEENSGVECYTQYHIRRLYLDLLQNCNTSLHTKVLLPWPKKLRQARTSNYRRVHARDSHACARWRVAVPIFLARVVD